VSDFINALISESPKSELKEKLNLFGQFIGEWDFDWYSRKGTPEELHVPGEWIFSWILEGAAIQDVFICPSRKEKIHNPQPNGEYGTTVRFYNPAKDTWNICYGGYGFMDTLEAKQVERQIIVTNTDNSEGLNQWVFSDITPTSFHWQNRVTKDNGNTWYIYCELFARKR